jgi:hypothetical protein
MRVDLEESEWNQVVDLIGEFKYKQVALLLAKIGTQLTRERNPAQMVGDLAPGRGPQKFTPEPLVPRQPDGKFD